jgi:hypothetical protein
MSRTFRAVVAAALCRRASLTHKVFHPTPTERRGYKNCFCLALLSQPPRTVGWREKRKRRTRLNAPPSVFYSLVSESTGLMVYGLDHWNPGSSNPPAEFQRPRNCIFRQGIGSSCSNPVAAPARGARILGEETSRQTRPLEVAPIGMVTRDTGNKTYRIRASVGVFHEAFRETQGLPQIPGPTFLRIRKTSPLADRAIGHPPSYSIPARASRAISRRNIPWICQLQFLRSGLPCCGD